MTEGDVRRGGIEDTVHQIREKAEKTQNGKRALNVSNRTRFLFVINSKRDVSRCGQLQVSLCGSKTTNAFSICDRHVLNPAANRHHGACLLASEKN
jgi:hypothetical protein